MPDTEMQFRIKAVDDASATFAKVRGEMSKTIAAGNGEGGGGLGGLADSLGSRRALSRVIGGGIAGLIGSEIATATQEMVKLEEEFRKGQLDATSLGVKIAESVPILGSWVTAGQAIREMLTGEKADMDALNAEARIQVDLDEFQNRMLRDRRVELEKHLETMRQLTEQAKLIGVTGPARGYASAMNESRKHAENVANALGDDAAKMPAEIAEAINKLNGEAASKLKEAKENVDAAKRWATDDDRRDAELAAKIRASRAPDARKDASELRVEEADNKISTSNAALKSLQDQLARDIAAKKKEYAEAENKAAENSRKEAEEIERERGRAIARAREDGLKRIADLQAAAREDQLRAAGFGYQAELVALKRQQDEENTVIKRALEDRTEAIKNDAKAGIISMVEMGRELATALADAARGRSAAQGHYDAAGAKASVDEEARQADRRLEVEHALADAARAQAEAIAAGSEAATKGLAVDEQRLAIHEKFLSLQRELQDALKSETDPSKRQRIQGAITALPGQEAAEQAGRLQQGVRDIAMQGLHNLAAGGDRRAIVAEAQAEIRKQFDDERAQIQAMLKDPSVTAEQRKALQAEAGTIDTQQKSAMARAARDGIEYNPFAHTELNQGGNRGLAMAAREHSFQQQHDDPAARDRKEMVQLLKTIAGHTETTAKKEQAEPKSVL